VVALPVLASLRTAGLAVKSSWRAAGARAVVQAGSGMIQPPSAAGCRPRLIIRRRFVQAGGYGGLPSPAASAPATGCHRGAWQSAPLSGAERLAAQGVPVLTAVRTAHDPECGYDRLVLDITGPLPGYAIRHVSQLRADPSDRLINLPGNHFLLRRREADRSAVIHLARAMSECCDPWE
jgi:hypothetical protein